MTGISPDDYRQRQRANMLVIAIVVAIVAGSVLLLVSLQQGIKRESCFAAGHRTCAPVEEQN